MPQYIDNPTTASRESAKSDIASGKRYPYDGRKKSKDWADKAARGIFANFSDRRGLKHELDSYDADVKRELVDTVAEIIRAAQEAG